MKLGDGNKKPLSRLPARDEAIESFETDTMTPNNHDLFSPFGIFEEKDAERWRPRTISYIRCLRDGIIAALINIAKSTFPCLYPTLLRHYGSSIRVGIHPTPVIFSLIDLNFYGWILESSLPFTFSW